MNEELNTTLANYLTAARQAKAQGMDDVYNATMNRLGQFIANQANTDAQGLYSLPASRGNYDLMSMAQNAYLASPEGQAAIRQMYNATPVANTSSRRTNKRRGVSQQPVQTTSNTTPEVQTEAFVSDNTLPAFSYGSVDINNLPYSQGVAGIGRLDNSNSWNSSWNTGGIFNNLNNLRDRWVNAVNQYTQSRNASLPTRISTIEKLGGKLPFSFGGN